MGRLASFIIIVLAVFTLSRAIIHALPGDPIDTILAETGTSLARDVIKKELGLDQPFWDSLIAQMRAALHGDLGKSILSREPITPLLLAAMGRSALLGGLGLLISLVLSVPLGIGAAQAISPLSRVLDKICTVYGALTASLPSPWLGPILMYLFAVRIPLFPITGHWLLPALVLALSLSGFWARLIRSRVRETLHHGSALCARARGLPQWKILLKYGFAPCAGPIAAYLGTQLGSLLGGLFVIEVIFGWPGLGALFVDSVLKRDYPVVEAALFASALIALLGNGLGDWMQDRVDPRRRVL